MKRHKFIINKYLVGMPEASAEDKDQASKTFTNLEVHCSHRDFLMKKCSREVSREVNEGKSKYGRKQSKLILIGKATKIMTNSNISLVIKSHQTVKSAMPPLSREQNPRVQEQKESQESSSFVFEFGTDTDLQIDSEEEERNSNSSEINRLSNI